MKKYNNNKRKGNKRRNNYPSPLQRLDDVLIAEVRLALQLGLSDNTIVNNYKITYSQLNYCKRANVSFNDVYNKEEKE